ncbi:HEAT repeat-containing protein [Toxoplasma gondii ME49]|uniref:HEAT repeat-containing protein n=10 Tax=Toxoplasma gondii TaxID=5811 RepID=A0A0F7V611_TOXGV|nr:HEAT repeat-containing protein [Toxoplasma gondii ME49]ESS28691.1 HEAT repeat-containing protein [Toxoplasma gondii VEG]KFG32469.1 HEAT repeat-containing protein [Toxoplasma gondii GAB2-2007-GAL-DOM2]KYF39192.1 HEAT repeat-containing protein [Toxoplasma gondii ARI]EPT25567.1 HEAT repeat-containing protein [Toxoplasma gondii ME49]CEL77911.1 TPA: transportin, putative [Toxoplasma gondii VEG]|eukprot:XP_018635254.1 HEAT repeat-containing protein [Toxoplasma gondii ME49]
MAAPVGDLRGSLLHPSAGGDSSFSSLSSDVTHWQPNAEHTAEIVALFEKAGSTDNAVQQQLAQAFQTLNAMVDAPCYLTEILSSAQFSSDVRQLAGLTLKSNLQQKQPHALPAFVSLYIRPRLLAAIEENEKTVRSAAGSAITCLLSLEGVGAWPEALQRLFQLLDDAREDVVDGAFSALSKIVEDAFPELLFLSSQARGDAAAPGASDAQGEAALAGAECATAGFNGGLRDTQEARPGREGARGADEEILAQFCNSHLLPKLFALALPPHKPSVRKHAVACLGHFAQNRAFAPQELFEAFFPQYWQLLGQLAQESDAEMTRFVVQGMVQVVEVRPDVVFNVTSGEAVLSFVVRCCGHEDYRVRLDAVEFWPVLLRDTGYHQPLHDYRDHALELLRHHLPTLLPLLVKNTTYHEYDYLCMDPSQLEDDNAEVADEARDIKPRFHRQSGPEGASEEEEEEDSRGTWGDGWSVRKGSALALDHIASVYREAVLPEVLPLIEASLVDANWERREAAVLALGALAQGCQDSLEPYLPNVLQFLLNLCDDPKPLLRSISCWCVSRYAAWICRHEEQFLKPVLVQILKHVLDRNKRVQEAACSAFATIEEEASLHLVPYLPDILSTLKQAFCFYQTKNLLILYDAVGTLADSVGSALATEAYSREIMEPLFGKFQNINNLQDPGLIGLFECVTNCATALGAYFVPYAQAVTERCVWILMESLTQVDRFEKGEQAERPSRDLIESCLDLLSGVTEALGPEMCELLAHQNLNFIPLLLRCCQDPAAGMLQSSFALVGDLSKHCVKFLQPHLSVLMPTLSEHLLHHATSVQNNAGWAIGELALRAEPQFIEPHVDSIASKLIGIVNCPELHRSLLQNVSISLGRLGIVCPAKLAPHLGDFLQQWCIIMRHAKNDEEKANGFDGVCSLIELNPEGCKECLYELVFCMLAFQPCPEKLNQKFALVLQALSQTYPDRWQALHDTTQTACPFLPPPMQQAVQLRFFSAGAQPAGSLPNMSTHS